jgi:hypothetical protein
MKALLTLMVLASHCFSSCGQTQNSRDMSNIEKFISSYSHFKMDIQAAGIATIPVVTFDNNILMIEYAYFSEGENRKGKMTLTFNSNTNRFEGNWQTNADNGNVYKGSLYFVFSENGEALGKYKFANSDYKITIFKTSK